MDRAARLPLTAPHLVVAVHQGLSATPPPCQAYDRWKGEALQTPFWCLDERRGLWESAGWELPGAAAGEPQPLKAHLEAALFSVRETHRALLAIDKGLVEAHHLALAANYGVAMETMTLYRAVSEVEFQQLMRTGKFAVVPSSLEGKFFAESAEDAAQWGEMLEGARHYRIVEVDLPTSVAQSLLRWEKLDGIGPAR